MTKALNPSDFPSHFQSLTGLPPLRWQERLYKRLCQNDVPPPSVIDLPTGLGKTMVMAIWLIARSINDKLKLPRRLIYVVDRRTVVDQATDLAEKLVKNWKEKQVFSGDPPAISTLRGQRADNREWSRDPSRPAIVIGTVDLIGSALLFSGYRSSYKRRPLEAGLLGQDSLLVLDEAHLSKPFEKLVKSITQSQKKYGGSPLQIIRMSATSGEAKAEAEEVFRLDSSDLQPDPDPETGKERNQIVTRCGATKRLTITTTANVIDALAMAAGDIAQAHPGARIVIFVKTPKMVDDVRKALVNKDKSRSTKIALLTGTLRGLERDELVTPPNTADQHERRAMQRFLSPDNDPSQGECFLISTSAGEVGFDLNADHLVGDDAPLDSWIQRLGRVNRRGTGDATVILITEKEPAAKTDFEKACIATSKRLKDGMDVSPKALATFKNALTVEQLKEASSPEPTTVELTDILLDAWSMTSITERLPGRPEVAPWLRGITEDPPYTTIAWRAELDVPGFAELDWEDIEEWFDTHPIRTHEALSVPTSQAAKWFTERWDKLDAAQQFRIGTRLVIVDRGGLTRIKVAALLKQLKSNSVSILNAELILPASFGGIERGEGLLNPDAPKPVEETDTDEKIHREDASADVADVRGRYRELVTTNEEGDTKTRIGSGEKPANGSRFVLELESSDDRRVQLVSYVPKRDKPEWGSTRQTLSVHVGLVRKRLDEILGRLDLPEPLKRAAQLAAEYHDHGKNRERWQRLVDGKATLPGEVWTENTIGKSGGGMKRDARHYRHEFGSIRECIGAHEGVPLTDSKGADITEEVIDLALHLIAVHHGRGRPHFPKGGFDPAAERRSAEIHTDIIRRFARLQRKYGWWRLAWLENLLRCADALASGGDA